MHSETSRSMKLHGKHISPELTAYDSRGLVAYTRDGRLAATGRKMFHLYDALCRPAVSGLCEDFLSDSDWGRVHDIPAVERTFLSSGVASDYNFSPSSLPAAAQVTRLWYYDRYLPGMAYAHDVEAPLGLPTAERTLVLDGWTAADTVTVEHHYDSMMHEMFTRRKHSDGTMLLCTTTRTPGGLPQLECIVLSGPLGSHSLTTYTEYDAFGRITSLKANSDRCGVLTLAQNSYDGVGRLASSTVHGGTETTCGYDVRGALTSADNPFIKQSWKYASGSSNPSYAGRISGKTVEYNDNGGSCSGSVTYRYDSMGRLKGTVAKRDILWKMEPPVVEPPIWKAGALELDTTDFKPVGPGVELRKQRDYSESFTYDLNSNILSLTRMGCDGKGQYASVDDLTMGYSGNRLTSLTDNAAEVTLESSMDIPSGWFSGRDFGYDAAGAVTRDVSRNIANIDYYFNGMPSLVGTMEGDCISYVYTADGEKLAETVWNGNRTTRRDYIGPFEFIGGQLLRINLPQGYIDSIGTLHAYIPDIQGNIVGVYEAREGNTKLEQLNEYYAYGGLTADSDGQDANRRKHTAKELTTDLGINTYDFTARSQYPMASRFDQPDKKSGDYTWLSPYIFCAADPINFSDPTGEIIILVNGYIGFGSPSAGAPYWNGENSGFVKGAKHFFNDDKTLFLEIDHGMLSSANERFQAGYNYAQNDIGNIKENLSDGESIKIVTHSMGAAFGEGMTKFFNEINLDVEGIVHLNAFQAGDIKSESSNNTTTIDYQNPNDLVVAVLPGAKPGNINNAIHIRELALRVNPTTWHRHPIIKGENFWKELTKKIENIFNE